MNNKGNYKKGKRREITELIMQTGGIPMRCIPLFVKENEATMRNQIYIMTNKGELIATDKGQNKVVTFNYKRESKNLTDINPKIIAYYEAFGQTDAYSLQSIKDEGHYMKMRNSETYLFMYGAGIDTKLAEKKSIFSTDEIIKPTYYSPRELKGVNGYAPEQIKVGDITGKTRTNGIVISSGGSYTVYDVYDQMFTLDMGEMRMKIYSNELLASKKQPELKGCLLLFKNGSSIQKYMYGPNYHGRENSSPEKLAFTYPKVYALTLDTNGQRLMQLMTHEGWEQNIYDTFLENTKQTGYEDMICDGKDKDGNYYMVFCSPDIKKLKEFIRGAAAKGEKERCRIICFDFQKDFIAEVAGKYCKIYTVKFNEYLEEVKLQEEKKEV